MRDLWPTDIQVSPEILPVTPLVEQAMLLATHTGNLVKGEVFPVENNSSDGVFHFDFDLVVKLLDYRFTLLHLRYGVEGYPASIFPYSKVCDELGLVDYRNVFGRHALALDAQDETQLLEALDSVLNSRTTRDILKTLMTQAQQFKR
ncbi:MAG: hypothetical protein IID44_23590 [Planctomycetes bacterium]|nr:hypothetical protein [Planctomycetota bacterium]